MRGQVSWGCGEWFVWGVCGEVEEEGFRCRADEVPSFVVEDIAQEVRRFRPVPDKFSIVVQGVAVARVRITAGYRHGPFVPSRWHVANTVRSRGVLVEVLAVEGGGNACIVEPDRKTILIRVEPLKGRPATPGCFDIRHDPVIVNVLTAHDRDARWATQGVDDSVIGECHSPFFERLQPRDLVEQFPIQIIGQDHHHVAKSRSLGLLAGRSGHGQRFDHQVLSPGACRGCVSRRRGGRPGGVLADPKDADGDGGDGGDAGDGDGVSTPA